VLADTPHRYIVSKGPQAASYELAPNMWGAEFLPQATLLPLVFLLLYGAGAVLLVDTAHRGGRLVHEFGVRAFMPPPGSPVAAVRPQPDK